MIVRLVISFDLFRLRSVEPADDIAPTGFLNRPTGARYHAERVAAMGVIITAHLMLAVWILSSASNFAVAPRSPSLVAIDMSNNSPAPDSLAKRAIVPPVPEDRTLALLPSNLKIAMAQPVAVSGDGNGCSVASAVSAALIADKVAMAELAALPTEVRSQADAVMLWNGAWLDDDPEWQMQMAQRQIPALRRVVTEAVLALPAACLEVQTSGPQLLPISEPERTTMVVIGSGVWRWSNLLTPPIDPGTTRQVN